MTCLVSPGIDLRETPVPVEGSDAKINMSGVSATSVRFKLGSRYGCLASILDMLKVAIPVAVFYIFFPDSPMGFLAATGAILGHNWPLYYRFQGGYGQSAMYGALLVLEWTAVPVNFFGTSIFYLIFRQVHIASIGGVLLLIPWLWYRQHNVYALLYAIICSVAYFIKVLPDFRALRKIESQASKPEEVDGGK